MNNDAYDKLLDILSYKDYSSVEVFSKLVRKGFSEQDSAAAVARAVKNGLIDDARYAESVAERKMFAMGRRGVENELLRRGIDRIMCQQILDELYSDFDPCDDIVSQMEKKLRGQDLRDPKVRNRVFGSFARKGYDFEDISRAFELCGKNRENEDE